MTPEPAGLVGFWRFDGPSLEGEWRGEPALRWDECDDQGGEWLTGGASKECGSERLGGTGASLRLQANGYVEAPLALEEGPLTLAAWVSLNRSTTQRMTLVSVVREGCQSAWLDLSADFTGQGELERHTVILSVEKPIADSTQCEVDEVKGNLPSGFNDWGMGNWYHVAAVVDAPKGHTVFVDGRSTSTSSTPAAQRTAELANAVHIGADPTGSQEFTGLIDDVATFSRAVTEDELAAFVSESTSVRADGQQWTPWSANGSSATWKNDCRNPKLEKNREGAQVVVKNGYWSAGGVFSRTHTGHNIRKLRKATLVADIPKGTEFDFALGSAHNAERCTWHASGTGKSRYEFDLDGLNNCDCPSSCDCRFSVEEARIGSRWDKNLPLDFSVCRVEFEWEEVEEDTMVDIGLGPGGVLGLNGWCWRPISYHEGSHVDIDEALTNAVQSVGTLAGINDTTAYLAADFATGDVAHANKLCDLQQVEEITLTADMPHDYSYQLRVADFNGSAQEWSRRWDTTTPTQTFVLCDSTPRRERLAEDPTANDDVQCGEPDDPISDQGNSLNLARVRHVGVQKDYEVAAEATTISIKSLEFTGTPKGNCLVSIASGGGPPE